MTETVLRQTQACKPNDSKRSKGLKDRKHELSMESVVGELQCPICLELFQCPTILPCSHVLCRTPCAERLFDHGFVRCPVCRDHSFVSGGVEVLPRVISLENIIERYQGRGTTPPPDVSEVCSQEDIPCQLCDTTPRKAIKSCLDCNASYCRRCLAVSHPDKDPFTSHQMVEPRKYPKPQEKRCPQHDMRANIYCVDCGMLACLLCADDPSAHPAHRILSLEQATDMVRGQVMSNLKQIEESQDIVSHNTQILQLKLHNFQKNLEESREQLNNQFDGLISEIETKREFFLSDLEYEEKSKTEDIGKRISEMEEKSTDLQGLVHCAKEVLKEMDMFSFLQLGKAVNDRMEKNIIEPFGLTPPSPTITTLKHKVVDLRKEMAVMKDAAYLSVPATASIDVTKCTRSASSVVLVLSKPVNQYDVIDGYEVFYCSEQQKPCGEQEKMIFKNSQEERNTGGRGSCSSNAVCLIQDNLHSDTMYYFCVRAYNMSGESEMSEIVNCRTLAVNQVTIPVPVIVEAQCRTYTFSIQIYSSSAVDTGEEDSISHYLLYREASVDKIWKSVSMYGRCDHRVFGLQPDTLYDFVIMACHQNGECQVSKPTQLRTERSAY